MPATLPTRTDLTERARAAATACGVDLDAISGEHEVVSPINGEAIASISHVGADAVDAAVEAAHAKSIALGG